MLKFIKWFKQFKNQNRSIKYWKLETTPVDLSKLSDLIKNEVVNTS